LTSTVRWRRRRCRWHREGAEAETAEGREVLVVRRLIAGVGERRRLVATPQLVNSKPGRRATVTGSISSSLVIDRLAVGTVPCDHAPHSHGGL
jgi:hypothetical protein